ncbi:hypothetical protein LTR73_006184 [Friedmanniomyces endolithicus]|nr:hypothetical protein LTR73_006184 [Friedmanniomyces endolithicus]
MPDPRPLNLQSGTYDHPPSSDTSDPRTRRAQLRRALHNTSDLAREMEAMADPARRPSTRVSPLGPINRRRPRPPTPGPDDAPDGSSSEALTPRDSRRDGAKRRRLDVDPAPLTIAPIRYGHFGQVEPGRLKMDFISCDGGEHVDPGHPSLYLGVKNILQHDKSVYCSVRRSCNILLKHADDTPFCLEKLHIVGPEHGFTAPVRGGLIHVAMTLQDLQKYIDPPASSAIRAFNDTSASDRHHRRSEYVSDNGLLRESPERLLTLSDALRDEQVNQGLGDLVGFAPNLGQRLDRQRGESGRDDRRGSVREDTGYYGADFDLLAAEDPEPQCDILPGALSSSDDHSPEDNFGNDSEDGSESAPVIVLSDEDVGPEENSSQEVLDFRLQRLRLQSRRVYSNEDNINDELTPAARRTLQGLRLEVARGGERLRRTRTRYGRRDGAAANHDNEDLFAEPAAAARLSGIRGTGLAGMGSGRRQHMPRPRGVPSVPARGARATFPGAGLRGPGYRSTRSSPPPSQEEPGGSGDSAIRHNETSETHVHAQINASANDIDDDDDDDGVTRARFRIREGKHKVSLKFSPAVSGRFVLLSLWGHAGDDRDASAGAGRDVGTGRDGFLGASSWGVLEGGGNVDVQSVVLKGYGGGRFFPSRVGI